MSKEERQVFISTTEKFHIWLPDCELTKTIKDEHKEYVMTFKTPEDREDFLKELDKIREENEAKKCESKGE